MRIPPNMTREEVIQVITKVAGQMSALDIFKFCPHTPEDISQTAWLIALKALDQYDGERPLENFLRVHIRNRLNNFKRDNGNRYDPPCKRCVFFDKKLPSQCAAYEDKNECDLWEPWNKRYENRQKFGNPVDISLLDPHSEGRILDTVSKAEIITLLKEKLPLSMRADFLRLLDGADISKFKEKNLFKEIKKILGGDCAESE